MPSEELSTALASGRAFVDLSSWRKVDVSGRDALAWLSHVGSADLDALAPGRARATLIRSERGTACEVTVALAGATVLVIQDPAQPESVLGPLSKFANSYDVALDDRTDALALFSFPGATRAPDVAGTAFAAPSCVGVGVDVFALAEDHAYLLGSLQHGFTLAELDDVRAWLEGRTGQQ
ncbi:MAG: Aminomethyltransferase folate-binding domain [Actinomycetota bacterium]|jgi:glycine cleavage system aminomethyltransferase T|nr:Aminomethyltransferase folate-binding domain [Actinomycetota bacterium]